MFRMRWFPTHHHDFVIALKKDSLVRTLCLIEKKKSIFQHTKMKQLSILGQVTHRLFFSISNTKNQSSFSWKQSDSLDYYLYVAWGIWMYVPFLDGCPCKDGIKGKSFNCLSRVSRMVMFDIVSVSITSIQVQV